MEGLNDGIALFANAYPVAWRIEVIDHGIHRGFGYVQSVLDIQHAETTPVTDALY